MTIIADLFGNLNMTAILFNSYYANICASVNVTMSSSCGNFNNFEHQAVIKYCVKERKIA